MKPANIKVRNDGTVKVLDPSPEGDLSQSPTLTAAATQMGVIMGTAVTVMIPMAKSESQIYEYACH